MVFYGVRSYVERMNRHRAKLALLAAAPLALALAALAATGTAAAAPAAPASRAIAYTAPSGTYSVYTNETHITFTITSNPSNDNVRAKVICTTGTFYGGWHTSGNTSATCGSNGKIASAYDQWPEANPGNHLAWIPGDSLNGRW